MKVIHVSFVQSNVQGQDTVVRIVNTLLVRRSGDRIHAGAREYFFFAETSIPALEPTLSVPLPTEILSRG